MSPFLGDCSYCRKQSARWTVIRKTRRSVKVEILLKEKPVTGVLFEPNYSQHTFKPVKPNSDVLVLVQFT